jgi:hypothetical protein
MRPSWSVQGTVFIRLAHYMFQPHCTWWLVGTSPLMDAVRVQLYKMASSPNALPGPILPNTFSSFMTSNSPSAETYKWEPAKKKCKQFCVTHFQLHKYIYVFSKELTEKCDLKCTISSNSVLHLWDDICGITWEKHASVKMSLWQKCM